MFAIHHGVINLPSVWRIMERNIIVIDLPTEPYCKKCNKFNLSSTVDNARQFH